MLLVSLLVCSASFSSSYFNLTDIYIQIKGVNTDLYNMMFESDIKNLTVSSKDLDNKNNCYEVSYYLDNNGTNECLDINLDNYYFQSSRKKSSNSVST